MLVLSLSTWLCVLLLQLCIKSGPHIFLISYSLQYIVLYNCTVLHMFLYFRLNQGIGSVTQCCHLMVRNDGFGGLELKNKGFFLLFLASLSGTPDFVLQFNIFFVMFQ